MFFYIHIPFCRQRCTYCKFALTPFVKDVQVRRYLAHLRAEIRAFFMSSKWSPEARVESVYFGGGTPSVLSVDQIREVLEEFPTNRFAETVEICLEANPEDITPEWAKGVLELGINRISLGVQTLNVDSLTAIQRSSPEAVLSALSTLSDSGYRNINVDFILGLPHVKPGETLADVCRLHQSFENIRHTSVYFLEKGLYPKDWAVSAMGDEDQRNEYHAVREYLIGRGFHHYEISNFGAPGYESRHNRAYWNHSSVRGFGLAAASYLDGERFENSSLFNAYYAGEVVDQEMLTASELRMECGMFGLRTFAMDSELARTEKISELEAAGLISVVGNTISPTPA